MILKTILVVIFAVDVFAEITITEEQFNKIINTNSTDDKEITEAIENYGQCIRRNMDADAFRFEIEAAKSNNPALREIFKKFCKKSSDVMSCLPSPATPYAPCPGASVDEGGSSINNTNEQLVNYLCDNDGDKVASFYTEGGPECLHQNRRSIRDCFKRHSGIITSYQDVKKLTVPEQCSKYDDITVCILKTLETCQSNTVHKVMESMLQYARNSFRLREIVVSAIFL